jgi:DNA-directed RNA polymerase specialized sigma24 family protein
MVIANGFISADKNAALQDASERASGKVRVAVMPPLCAMTYFVSDKGEMFGCQQMKNFCLTKPLRIEKRYSLGCHIRYSVGGGKQLNAYMQYIMYSTFVSHVWDDNLILEPKDGNVYNYQLDNIKVKSEDHSLLRSNVNMLSDVYGTYFMDVAWYARYVSVDIELQDAKDIASNAFFELCNISYPYMVDNFVGLWKSQVRKRSLDFLSFRNRFTEQIFTDDGEERYGNTDRNVEVEDLWWHIRGDKCRQTMRLYAEGETPTEIAERIGSKRASVASCITRTIQHLQGIYANDIYQAVKVKSSL